MIDSGTEFVRVEGGQGSWFRGEDSLEVDEDVTVVESMIAIGCAMRFPVLIRGL